MDSSLDVRGISTEVVALSLGDANPTHSDPFRAFDGIMDDDERPRSSPATQDRVASAIGLRTVDSGGGQVAMERQDANSQLLKDHYLNVRDLIIGDKHAALLDDVNDFSINFSMEVATFTGPDGDRVVIDLLKLSDGDAQEYVDAYLNLADKALNTRKHRPFTVSAQSKGNASKGAPRAFRRGTPALDALPKSFTDVSQSLLPQLLQKIPDAQMRRTVVKRVMRAEFIQRRALQDLRVEITAFDGDLQDALKAQRTDPAYRGAANSLGEEVDKLRELQKEIASVDAAGLAIGLAHFPNDMRIYQSTREDAATRAQEFTDDLLNVDDDTRTDDADVAAERGYGKDVGGVFHQQRLHYKEHTQSQGIAFKKEGFEDVLLRAVIDFERKEMRGEARGYDPVFLYQNDFISPNILRAAQRSMEHAQTRMALDLTPHFDDRAFEDLQEYPPGATDKGKGVIDAANATSIATEITRLRGATPFEAAPPVDDDDSDDGRI